MVSLLLLTFYCLSYSGKQTTNAAPNDITNSKINFVTFDFSKDSRKTNTNLYYELVIPLFKGYTTRQKVIVGYESQKYSINSSSNNVTKSKFLKLELRPINYLYSIGSKSIIGVGAFSLISFLSNGSSSQLSDFRPELDTDIISNKNVSLNFISNEIYLQYMFFMTNNMGFGINYDISFSQRLGTRSDIQLNLTLKL